MGPWLICAASYCGPEAPDLARQLVIQLRTRYKRDAYLFNRSEKERREQNEEFARQQQANPLLPKRRRTVRIEEEVAVLIGGYPTIEAARQALDSVKKLATSRVAPQFREAGAG